MKQKHILVVDDVTINLRCAGEVLKEHYKITMVKSGQQALEIMKEIKPDLILLDVKMPQMDGYETLRKIKEEEEYRSIPVVFMTAESSAAEAERAMLSGAADYIYKPLRPDMMLAHMKQILGE